MPPYEFRYIKDLPKGVKLNPIRVLISAASPHAIVFTLSDLVGASFRVERIRSRWRVTFPEHMNLGHLTLIPGDDVDATINIRPEA